MIPLDREKLAKHTKAQILDEAEAVLEENDKAHGRRLRLQAESIQRLLRGRTYEEEMDGLQRRITELEARLEQAHDELRRLRGDRSTLNPVQVL